MKNEELLNWLYAEGRFQTDFASFIDCLSLKLNEMGVPVERLRMNFRALHPEIDAWSCIWDKGQGAQVLEIHKSLRQSPDYLGSPIEHVIEKNTVFRQSLTELPEDAHAVLYELKQQNLTDYFACPIIFSNKMVNASTYATNRPSGFSDDCIEFLTQLSNWVAPIIETLATKRLARNLLETYIGPRTGNRILEGQIRRGDGERINAAIWFSDFRNFTQYTETLSLEKMLEALNSYFELVHENVVNAGGEILRFIGDAMLIVFPVDENVSITQACEQAVCAAICVQKQAIEVNQQRKIDNKPKIEFGIGLHEGCVMYGNVGARTRLDFTVMGVAVNRTARLESLTKELNCPVLISGEFNEQIEHTGYYQGQFSVKGVKSALDVYSVDLI